MRAQNVGGSLWSVFRLVFGIPWFLLWGMIIGILPLLLTCAICNLPAAVAFVYGAPPAVYFLCVAYSVIFAVLCGDRIFLSTFGWLAIHAESIMLFA